MRKTEQRRLAVSNTGRTPRAVIWIERQTENPTGL